MHMLGVQPIHTASTWAHPVVLQAVKKPPTKAELLRRAAASYAQVAIRKCDTAEPRMFREMMRPCTREYVRRSAPDAPMAR